MAADTKYDDNGREDGEVIMDGPGAQPVDKHPLENRWTLWFDPGAGGKSKAANWGDTLTAVHTFDTIEDFWCLFNNILTPGKLNQKSNLYLFKADIRPAWEDKGNHGGGTWQINVPKQNAKQLLDKWWMNLLMAMVGEQFEAYECICGVACNIRMPKSNDRIGLWTSKASDEAAQMSIGKQIKEFCEMDDIGIGFMSHDAASAGVKANQYNV